MAITIQTNGMAAADKRENPQTQAPQYTQNGSTAQNKAENADVKTTDASTAATTPAAATPAAVTEGTQAEQSAAPAGGAGTDFSAYAKGYEGKYDEQLADLYNQITQRKAFDYSTEDDKLYQQYVDRYTKGGRLAMEDTMGQAAALTGGYGNSYAQRVGQQSYDEYMTALADKGLELRNLAYQQYKDEGAELRNNYAMLENMEDRDYSRWGEGFDRAMAEAALRANSGDFEAYRQLYGEDSAARMQQNYAATVLMPLYKAGQIDAETYKEIAGVYPVGYTGAGNGRSGYASWDGWNVPGFKNNGTERINGGGDEAPKASLSWLTSQAFANGNKPYEIAKTPEIKGATAEQKAELAAEFPKLKGLI